MTMEPRYEMLKQKRAVNPSCEMTHVGLPLLNLKAGWMESWLGDIHFNELEKSITVLHCLN